MPIPTPGAATGRRPWPASSISCSVSWPGPPPPSSAPPRHHSPNRSPGRSSSEPSGGSASIPCIELRPLAFGDLAVAGEGVAAIEDARLFPGLLGIGGRLARGGTLALLAMLGREDGLK